MKRFTDANNREWFLSVNVDSINRVKELTGFDFLATDQGSSLERLIDDPVLLCNVAFCLIKEQADAAGVTDRDFGRALAGDAIDRATDALLEEYINFFPSRKRGIMAQALAKVREIEGKAIELTARRIEGMTLESVEAALAATGRAGASSLLSAPQSSDSTPAATRPAS